MSPEQISTTYRVWEILARRWLATWLDLLFLGFLIWGVVTLGGRQAALGGGLGLLVLALYYPLTEGLFGRTFGKLLCGLRVVDERGSLPGLGKATLRTLCRLVEINPVLMGGVPAAIAVFNSKSRQRMGDQAARTFVLKTEDLPLLSAPGTPGAPAIQEFSLPLGMPLTLPLAAGGVPLDPFGRPQRLPTRNRVWALPAAVVLSAATAGLVITAIEATRIEKRARPVVVSCAKFLAAPPKEGWYQLQACDYVIQDALYAPAEADSDSTESENSPAAPSGAEIGDVYVPVFATRENEGKKSPLLVKLSDERTRKLVGQIEKLDGDDQKQVARWLEQHFAELEVRRDITGTLGEQSTVPEAILKQAAEDKSSRLSVPFVVLSEGEEPTGWGSLSAIGGAFILGLLAAMAWLLAFVALADSGGPPPTAYGIHR